MNLFKTLYNGVLGFWGVILIMERNIDDKKLSEEQRGLTVLVFSSAETTNENKEHHKRKK